MAAKTWVSVMPSFTLRHAAASLRYSAGAHAVNGTVIKQARSETAQNVRVFVVTAWLRMGVLAGLLARAVGVQLSSIQTRRINSHFLFFR